MKKIQYFLTHVNIHKKHSWMFKERYIVGLTETSLNPLSSTRRQMAVTFKTDDAICILGHTM